MNRLLPFPSQESLIFHFSLADFDPVSLAGAVGTSTAVLVQVQQKTEIGHLDEDGWSPLLPFFRKAIKHITQRRASSLFYNSNHGLGLSGIATACKPF